MYFYEIHEGDDQVGTAVILAHETRFEARDFLKLVLEARARVLNAYREDSLTEAIAAELERSRGFVYVSDDRLTAAVNVSDAEGETYLAATRTDRRSIYLPLDERQQH